MEEQATIKFAGFWRRTLAAILDGLIVLLAAALVVVVVWLIMNGILHLSQVQPQTRALIWLLVASLGGLIYLWSVWLYFCLMESSHTQATLGKMALGIKVVDTDGERITFERATARYFSKWVAYAILLIGILMVAFSSRKQGLHDIVTRCMIVDKYWS